ncbi:hypothetical protein MIMGU_mgv1a006612mg [Erythranthe guttata]|uniref:RRM domain-containing protein n=1 Tax=Erythranthe guttata TaxID=4155 RepID=A0A022PVM0_ERYGU|nr:hypothetical protein MIMGU_mgv1a006612mg [Erythranthe guttata]
MGDRRGKAQGVFPWLRRNPDILDGVLEDRHVIDGRTVEAKRALSREEQQVTKVGNPGGGARNFGGGGGSTRTKKIFVGGLPPTLSEDGFRQYFDSYGVVTDVVIMYDQQTNRPRGFGFISFDSEDAVDRVLHKTFHDLSGKQVEVKRALPKDANPGGGGGRSMGGGGAGYGSSAGNSSSYDGRMESNRYMQSQNSGGGFPSYGSSGYGGAGYGYGPTNTNMGYGYGNYGGANPGYGGGAYGNPNAPNAGYGGPPSAQRSSLGYQAASGYGYGSSQWGAPSGGIAPGGGGAASGQSPSGASGYGNQGYGYGGYGGSDGAYGNQAAAYGAVGGRAGSGPNGGAVAGDLQSGGGGGYAGGGGYGDGANSGYGNSGWRSDPSQASGNYGGGYGWSFSSTGSAVIIYVASIDLFLFVWSFRSSTCSRFLVLNGGCSKMARRL